MTRTDNALDVAAIDVRISPLGLEGVLAIPKEARAVVAFAHGSGSSRLSPRNTQVAAALNADGFATLLFDLLTEDEAQDRNKVFDISLLSERLRLATDWLAAQEPTRTLPLGYFGASTGAAAALVAAAHADGQLGAVVSRGGRPDLAQGVLLKVRAPTLLIVGEQDPTVLELNRDALTKLRCDKQLAIVPTATHLFEEPGTLDEVIRLASDWFQHHLVGAKQA